MQRRLLGWFLGLAVLAGMGGSSPLLAQVPPAGWRQLEPPSAEHRRQHVAQAIEHLDRAGFGKQSEALRELLSSLDRERMQHVLREKLRQLETLQSDIAQLREQLGPASELVQVQVEVLEVSLDKLQKGKVDLQKLSPEAGEVIVKFLNGEQTQLGTCRILRDGDSFRRKVTSLKDNSLVRILARPQIMTTSGQSASIHMGGQQPVVDMHEGQIKSLKYEDFGIRINVRPHVLAERRLQMDLNFEQKGRNTKGRAGAAHSAKASSQVTSGQTLLICAHPEGKPQQGQGIVILVTPHLIGEQGPHYVPVRVPVRSDESCPSCPSCPSQACSTCPSCPSQACTTCPPCDSTSCKSSPHCSSTPCRSTQSCPSEQVLKSTPVAKALECLQTYDLDLYPEVREALEKVQPAAWWTPQPKSEEIRPLPSLQPDRSQLQRTPPAYAAVLPTVHQQPGCLLGRCSECRKASENSTQHQVGLASGTWVSELLSELLSD